MIFAIGAPGGPVRMYIETDEPERVGPQCQPGEIACPAVARLPWATIVADGSGIVPGAAPADYEAERVRARRTALLAACDWTALPDSPLSEAQRIAWRAYRQALRDLPASQPGATLETVDWPVEPTT